jgi:hypothetical protein
MATADNYTSAVQELYVAYFGRPADYYGLQLFDNLFASINAPTSIDDLAAAYTSNPTVHAVIDSFGTSAESAALYGTVTSNQASVEAFVNAIYANLFNRAAEPAGLAYWADAITSGRLTLGDTALAIATGAPPGSEDALSAANKVAVASNFTAALNTPALIDAYNGAYPDTFARAMLTGVDDKTVPSDYAATITTTLNLILNTATSGDPGTPPLILTSGADTATAATFSGVLSNQVGATTLNATDVLTGKGTNNVLNLSSDGTALTTGATLNNIEIINITASADQSSADVSAYATLNALNIIDLAGATAHSSTVTAGSVTAVGVNGHVLNGSANLSVNGGSTVTLFASGTTVIGATSLGNIGVNNAAGAVSITSTQTDGTTASRYGSITVQGGNGVTINSTQNAGAFTSTAGTINVAGANGAVAVKNAVNVTTLTAIAVAADAITVSGGSTIAVNETVTTIAHTTSVSTVTEGAVTINGDATTTSVSVSQAAAGAGHIAVAAVAAVAPVVGVTAVPAGPGVAPVAGVTAVAGSPAVAAVAGNATVVDGTVLITDAAHATATTASNTITSVALSGYGAGSSFTGNALTALSLSGTGGTLAITNIATGTDLTNTALALSVNGLSAGVITDTKNEIVTLNVTTGTTASSISNFADTGLTTLNIAGSSVLSLGSLPTALNTLTVSGDAGFNGSIVGTAVSAFATTATGAITMVLNATTQSFSGGSGRDVVSISADATRAISGGSATNNEIVFFGKSSLYTAANSAANISGFSNFGVFDNGANADSYDMAVFTGYKVLDIIAASTVSDTFSNVAAGTTLAINTAAAAVSYSLATPSATTSATAVIGNGATKNLNVGSLTFTDSDGGGISKVFLASSGSGTNMLTKLSDNSLSSLMLSGGAGLTVGSMSVGKPGQAAPNGVASFSISNIDTSTVTINNFIDDQLATLAVAGTGTTAFGTLEVDNSAALTINNTSNHALTINNLLTNGNIADLTHDGLSNLTFTGSQNVNIGTLADPGNTAAISITNAGTAVDSIAAWTPGTSVTSLSISGNILFGASATSATALGTPISFASSAGVGIAAATDNVRLNIALSGAADGNTDTVTAGNGNNVIVDNSTAGHVNVTVGSGASLISLASGNTTADYLAKVTLGTHNAAGGGDVIGVGHVAAATSAASVVISGAVSGDTISFADQALTTVVLNNLDLATVADSASLAAAVALVDARASTIAHSVTAFNWDGNTYVLASAAAGNGTLSANDSLVELVGVHSFTTTTGGHLVLAS